MGRIIAVLSLVALLAAAIVIPAVAHPEDFASSGPTALLADWGLISGPPAGTEESSATSDNASNSGAISPTDTNDLSARSLDSSSSGSSSSDFSNTSISSLDPNDPAAVSQEFSERRITSGAASPSSSFSNSGDNVNACPTTQQVVNTGNVANQQGVSQYNTNTDDIDLSGSSINIDSSATATCDQTLNQAAAAGK